MIEKAQIILIEKHQQNRPRVKTSEMMMGEKQVEMKTIRIGNGCFCVAPAVLKQHHVIVNDMKILFVCSGTKNGKASPIVKSQAASLEDFSINVDFFCIFKKGFKGYLLECLRLRRYLEENKYDLLHAHYGLSAIVGLLGIKKEKLIVSFMGDDLIGSNRKDGGVTRFSLFLSKIHSFLSLFFYSHTIVKSKEMLPLLNTENKSLVPNGVNLNLFKPSSKKAARKILGVNQSSDGIGPR